MNKVQLGSSDLQVTPICLGTMTFGEQVHEQTAHSILDRAMARGINFMDAAEMYSVPARAETFGVTETILGNWFAKHPSARNNWVVATKVAGPARGMPWIRNGSPDLTAADIVGACEASLKRLKTDVIDLYQIHWPARNVPMFGMLYFDPSKDKNVSSIHTQLEALGTLVKAGKVRQLGLSEVSSATLRKANAVHPIAAVQSEYSLWARDPEISMLETCAELGTTFVAYSPLGRAFLTGALNKADLAANDFRKNLPRFTGAAEAANQVMVDGLGRFAKAKGITNAQVALAWLLCKHPHVVPIPGTRRINYLEQNCASADMLLSAREIAELDALFPPDAVAGERYPEAGRVGIE